MLSVAILTFNSARTLKKTLISTADLDEVIICDTGSEDATFEIAATFANVKFYRLPFQGFGPLRNLAAAKARNDWILALDSDEVLSDELLLELKKIKLDEGTAYNIPFLNFYNGRLIKGCGWHPESHLRLYNRKKTAFLPALVHEELLRSNLKIQNLCGPIRHTPMLAIEDFLKKIQRYSTLWAEQNRGQKSSALKALGHGVFAFCKSYFLQKGFFYGREGLVISAYNGNCAFYKYLKLQELNQTC
ncbi:MAG: glycosyltransferase family 2 protein [Parachlamydiales bacterium]|jgi:glycosyltransferase involved in cell wall biosynthesis